ncbi:hypothetical protein D3C85_969170 [compost metagenome]
MLGDRKTGRTSAHRLVEPLALNALQRISVGSLIGRTGQTQRENPRGDARRLHHHHQLLQSTAFDLAEQVALGRHFLRKGNQGIGTALKAHLLHHITHANAIIDARATVSAESITRHQEAGQADHAALGRIGTAQHKVVDVIGQLMAAR